MIWKVIRKIGENGGEAGLLHLCSKGHLCDWVGCVVAYVCGLAWLVDWHCWHVYIPIHVLLWGCAVQCAH